MWAQTPHTYSGDSESWQRQRHLGSRRQLWWLSHWWPGPRYNWGGCVGRFKSLWLPEFFRGDRGIFHCSLMSRLSACLWSNRQGKLVLVYLTVHTLHASTGQSHCAHTAYKYWSILLCTHYMHVLVNLTVHTLHASTKYWSISLCTHCIQVLVNLTVHTLHACTGQSHCAHTAYMYWSILLCTHCMQVLVNLTVHTLHACTGQSHCAHTACKY